MFINELKKNQLQETENGALGYVTSGKALVDLNFGIPSYRDKVDTDKFDEAYNENPNLALRWLLYLRDIREGVGERKSFRDFVVHLCNKYPETAIKFMREVPFEEYGRWDDLVWLAYHTTSSEIRKILIERIRKQFIKDKIDFVDKKSISLLPKWLPSENSSSKATRKLARFVRKEVLGYRTSKMYRQDLSTLRKYLNIVETKISANEWHKVEYEKVPSKANILYRNAFMLHDGERRAEYLESLKRGETKINAQAMFLHDIVHAYVGNYVFWDNDGIKEYDSTLEELWKAQETVGGFKNTLVVRDGSGSMTDTVGNSSVSALDVADAISIYCAENNTGEYKDNVITFSREARFIDLSSCTTLREKINKLRKNSDYENTNIENVFDLILRTAVKSKMPQEEMPENVLIISDMEYDACTYNYNGINNQDTLFETITNKFVEKGYKMPKLIFWNVNSRTNTMLITQNENGVILLSGFSKNLMNMVMSSELDPYRALVNELKKERYDMIDKIV